MANRWSHTHGKTLADLVPCSWKPTESSDVRYPRRRCDRAGSRQAGPGRVTVIYVTSRKGHELATAELRTVCTCENASISCAFRTLLGFAAAKNADVGNR